MAWGTDARTGGYAWPFGRPLTSKDLLVVLTVVLAVIVVILLWILFKILPGRSFSADVETSGLEPVVVITGPGSGQKPFFDRPMGVAIGVEDRIYVADTGNHRVCVFEPDGDFLFEFGGHGVLKPLPGGRKTWQPGLMNFPMGIDTDEEGNVYVADFRNDQVQVFDSEGRFVRAFPDAFAQAGRGSSGQDGGGIAVTDVSVCGDKVFACDTYQVIVFDTEGELLAQFGKPGTGRGDLDHPNGVSATSIPGGSEVVYVSDSNHSRVIAFDGNGTVLWQTGEVAQGVMDQTAGPFDLPRGLTVSEEGNIIVVDAFQFGLVEVAPDGSILQRYGTRGVEPGQLDFPNDVDLLDNGLVLADKENDRVQVVRLDGAGS